MCCGSYLHVARSFFISQVPCTQKLLLISAQGIAPPTLTPPTNTTESIRWIKYVISDYRKCLHICLYMCLLIVWFMCVCVFTWTLPKVFDINLSLFQAGSFSDLAWITVRLAIWSTNWIHIKSTAVYITYTPAQKMHITCMFTSREEFPKWALGKEL